MKANQPALVLPVFRGRVAFFLATILVAAGWFPALGAGLELAKNGVTRYVIILATNAIPSERYAAEELQTYLKKITGATLLITNELAPRQAREILVGGSSRTSRLELGLEQLGPEGFALRTDGKRLIIAGGRPRGTLYGVYELLERHLGVRWLTPEVERAPRTNRLVIARLKESKIPALEYREVFWTEVMRNADFAARHRLNGHHYPLQAKHGGRPAVYFPFVHSFDSLVPADLFAAHPEYFPMIKGKRVGGYVQRCLANPEVLRLSIERVRSWIREHPEVTIVSVSQNDTGNWCQCPECKALDDAEGSPSASVVRFVNAIAENIEKDYPAVRLDTLAYQYTRKPPKTLRPRRNVIIRLCSIECCFAHPLASCASVENQKFRDDILAWQPIAPSLYVWDYTPNFAHYQQPFPNFGALQPNVRFFVEHGVNGLFEQGNYSPGGSGELEPLRAYLLARLLWDPETNLEACMEEFLSGYYGRAASGMRAYVQLLEDQVRDGGTHARIYDSPQAGYLNPDFLERANRILDSAESAADDESIRFRVRVAHLPVWYVQLATRQVKGEEHRALLEKWLAIAHQAGISHISEGQSLKAWEAKMLGQ